MATPINFQGYKIESISYNFDENKKKKKKKSSIIPSIECGLTDNNDEGVVIISIDVEESSGRELSIIVNGLFSINKDMISDVEKIHHYLYVNGSAILMPYVRSIISMITSLDSPRAMVIPTINILDFFNDSRDKE